MWWKTNKRKVLLPLSLIIVLVAAFWYGGSSPGLRGWDIASSDRALAEKSALTSADGSASPDALATSDAPEDQTDQKGAKEQGDEIPLGRQEGNDEQTALAGKGQTQSDLGLESRPGGSQGGLSAAEKEELARTMTNKSSSGVEQGDEAYAQLQGMSINSATGKDRYLTDPVPEGKPVPVDPEKRKISSIPHTCTLSVRCDRILENLEWLEPEKVELVPEDGVIFAVKTVTFYEGESVFNVLQREMKKAGIHMEFNHTPIYNSAYIEGIHNLYQFDCGELSGWMYKVNDWFPNYGCSRYQLQEGDVIEWVYTCNLGIDVGGYSAVGN